MVIWTSSRPLPTPTYDAETKRWTIVVDRDGSQTTIHPAHVVLATGTLGKPRYPEMHDEFNFRGTTLHANEYAGGHAYIGKRVVVIGAGNTAADICQDLVVHGAQSVTMVQRSSTCVLSARTAAMLNAWPEGIPVDISDLKFLSCPFHLLKRIIASGEKEAWEREKTMHEGLIKAGFKLNMADDGAGQATLVFERFGGRQSPA